MSRAYAVTVLIANELLYCCSPSRKVTLHSLSNYGLVVVDGSIGRLVLTDGGENPVGDCAPRYGHELTSNTSQRRDGGWVQHCILVWPYLANSVAGMRDRL